VVVVLLGVWLGVFLFFLGCCDWLGGLWFFFLGVLVGGCGSICVGGLGWVFVVWVFLVCFVCGLVGFCGLCVGGGFCGVGVWVGWWWLLCCGVWVGGWFVGCEGVVCWG